MAHQLLSRLKGYIRSLDEGEKQALKDKYQLK
ncbi:hypothetical protein M2133_002569 [Parabacteroides sp. PF5-6]|nr:hypothetical protein [Parabacteroides sp. PF5-6]